MSSVDVKADKVCANCGKAEVDDVKWNGPAAGVDNIRLEECDKCDLVKYCSTNCREEHREQHHEECKRRADILHDKRLFTQPDGTHLGECPICFLPMSLGPRKSIFMQCCGKRICNGCISENFREKINTHDNYAKATQCVFCRTSPSDEEEYKKRIRERIEANDPAALFHRGKDFYEAGDYNKALEYFTKAAELGDAQAHYNLGGMYLGVGVGVEKDAKKTVYHLEKAAIGGHPYARHDLACCEEKIGNMERAVKHWIIAANLGCVKSMKELLSSYKNGYITKEEYGATLRSHQATINAAKSSQREAEERSGLLEWADMSSKKRGSRKK